MAEYDHLRDYDMFVSELPDLMKSHENKFVVYHNAHRDAAVHDQFAEAYFAGIQTHGAGQFSAQQVVPQVAIPARLGF